jgi:hypothetical protein
MAPMRTLAIGLVILATASAAAQPETPSAERDAPDDRRLTIMWAPIRAIIPLVEVTAEYRAADKIGVMLELGGGRRTISNGMTDITGTEYEAGAQARYYVFGSFTRGWQIGAEVLDEYVAFHEPLPPGVVAAAAGGVTAGAFGGYKIATRVGFTFEAQLGARYLVMDPHVTGTGMPTVDSSAKLLPLLHINVGWTF